MRWSAVLVPLLCLLTTIPHAAAQHKPSNVCIQDYLRKLDGQQAPVAELPEVRRVITEIGVNASLDTEKIVIHPCHLIDNAVAWEGEVNGVKGRYIFYNSAWVEQFIGRDRGQLIFLFGHELGHFADGHFPLEDGRSDPKKELWADRYGACAVARSSYPWVDLRKLLIRLRPTVAGIYAGQEESLSEAEDAYRKCGGTVSFKFSKEFAKATKVLLTSTFNHSGSDFKKDYADLVIPLQTLIRQAGRLLTPAAADLKPTEDWTSWIFPILFDPYRDDNARWRELEKYVSENLTAKLDAENVSKLYCFFMYITPDSIRSALVIIDIAPDDKPKVQRPIISETPASVKERSPKQLATAVVRQLLNVVRSNPSLMRNRKVFADCFALSLDSAQRSWMALEATYFGRKLAAIWLRKSDKERFDAIFRECDAEQASFGFANDEELPLERLAEIVIRVTFGQDDMEWQAYASWDDARKYPNGSNARPFKPETYRPETGRSEFRKLTEKLAQEIDDEWRQVVGTLRHD